MNGAEFYEHFKNALRAVGLDWHSKDQAKITVNGDYLVIEHGGLQMNIRLKGKR